MPLLLTGFNKQFAGSCLVLNEFLQLRYRRQMWSLDFVPLAAVPSLGRDDNLHFIF